MAGEQCPAGLDEALSASSYLAVAVLDREMNVVWHNKTYARMLDREGQNLAGLKCYEAAGGHERHVVCPAAASLAEGKCTRGFYDYGEQNAILLTMPLQGGLAVKVFTFVPKETGQESESAYAEG